MVVSIILKTPKNAGSILGQSVKTIIHQNKDDKWC